MSRSVDHSPVPAMPAAPCPTTTPSGSRRRRLKPLCTAAVVVAGCAAALSLAHRHHHVYVVETVLDGDTFGITFRGEGRLVQLAGADAPEIHKGEPFAHVAREYLEARIAGKKVWLDFLDSGDKLDYKHRLLCWAWLDGENISATLITEGYARFSGAAERQDRDALVELEHAARQASRGMWSARPVVQPREDRP